DGSFARVDVKRVTRAMLSLSIDLVRWYRLEGSDSPEELSEVYADLALKLVSHPAPTPGSGGECHAWPDAGPAARCLRAHAPGRAALRRQAGGHGHRSR